MAAIFSISSPVREKSNRSKLSPDVGGIFGAGDNDVAVLDVPAQDDLGIGLAVFPAQLREQGLFQQGLVAVSQGIPGLDKDVLLAEELFELLFLEIRMHLRLEYGRLYLAQIQNFPNLFLIEVGKADGLYLIVSSKMPATASIFCPRFARISLAFSGVLSKGTN